MNLGEVLSKAWKIIWKNKVLWIFGILSSCGRGSGGGGGGGNSNFNSNGSGNDLFSNGKFPGLEEFGRNMENSFTGSDSADLDTDCHWSSLPGIDPVNSIHIPWDDRPDWPHQRYIDG